MDASSTSNRSTSAHRVSNLERGLDIIELLRDFPAGLTLSEIVRKLELSKNLTFRITSTLLERNYLDRDEATMRFTLSRKLLTMGYGAEAEAGLLETSLGPMRRFRDETGETVTLVLMMEDEGMVLEHIPGLHRFRFVVETGMRFPIHVSAGTKAMLAYMPESDALARLNRAGTPRLTSETLTTDDAFLAEFEEIRRLGYGVDRAEGYEGVHCVAAPIFDATGQPVAAINVTGPAIRILRSAFPELGPIAKRYADEISERLGYIPR